MRDLDVSLPSRERGLKPDQIIHHDRINTVAPFTGAWIETSSSISASHSTVVAPFTGAWIETPITHFIARRNPSLPSRERGLKRGRESRRDRAPRSLPSRERGLKPGEMRRGFPRHIVAPFTGAWIETGLISIFQSQKSLSLPSRERGLKQNNLNYECKLLIVAPFTGAWIETSQRLTIWSSL